jgi:predicted dehydrogenase
MSIRVGLLGAGFIGTVHAQAYEAIPEANLVAVADAKQQAADKLAQNCGAKAYYDVEQLMDREDLDVIDVCLPTFLHESCVVGAAERGRHVICEKPVALSVDQVDRMRSAVRKAGVMAMVAQVIRFWPQYVVIRKAFSSGRLGKPLMATASRLAEPPDWGVWFKDPNLSGGALLDLHIHDLDYIFSLFGRPQSVYAAGVSTPTGAWDHVITSLDYGDGRAVAEASFMMPPGFPFQMTFKLLGTEGCAEYRFRVGGQVDQREHAETELVIYRPGEPPEHPDYSSEDAYATEIAYFVRCVAEGRPPVVATLEEARTVLEIALAARRSLETRQAVQL